MGAVREPGTLKNRRWQYAAGLLLCGLLGLSLAMLALINNPVRTGLLYWYNQRRWMAQGISDYRYTLEVICFCPPEPVTRIKVEVHDGVPTSITDSSGTDVTTDYFNRYSTIDRLFDRIQSARREADNITVSYDPAFSYPFKIEIDWTSEVVDDELSLRIIEFESLPD